MASVWADSPDCGIGTPGNDLCHPRSSELAEVPVTRLPRIYEIVRQGKATAVTVGSDEEVFALGPNWN